MNPADDATVPIPEFYPAAAVHPIAAALINAPKDGMSGLMAPVQPALPKDHPSVAAGVAELSSMFADALTPSEVAFHNPPKPKLAIQSSPPKNFLQAHMVIIDQLLMDPGITTTRLAHVTGYSMNWLHKVMNSDAFQAKLAEKQKAICDPIVLSAIKDRLNGLVSRTLEIMEERMEKENVPLDAALEVFSATSKAMGLGVKDKTPVVAQQFIVHVPPRMTDASAWASQHSGREPASLAEPIDITPSPTSGASDAQ